MTNKLEVSFNSPQCGWMSVGFSDGTNEFHTTTAHAPYENVLSSILQTLSDLVTESSFEKVIKWNRLPEEFDFIFILHNKVATIEIYQFPTSERVENELVYSYSGDPQQIAEAFHETFIQLYEARETDEFEQNWHQPFPYEDFKNFEVRLSK